MQETDDQHNIKYEPGIHFTQPLITALQIHQQNHKDDDYRDRLQYWSHCVQQMTNRVRDIETFARYTADFPDSIGQEILATLGTLILSMAETFNHYSTDPDADLSEFVEAVRLRGPIIDKPEQDTGPTIVAIPDMDVDMLRDALTRYLAGAPADTGHRDAGGYL